MKFHVGDSFRIDTPKMSTRGVIVKINRKTVVYDAPYWVCEGVPDGWVRGLRIARSDMDDAQIFHEQITPG